MKKAHATQPVPTQFWPEVAFEVMPLTPAQARTELSAQFHALRNRLIRRSLLSEASLFDSDLMRVANEAAALAWTTPYPLLVMPALFEEKLQSARVRMNRQQQIHSQSQEIVEMVL